MPDAISKKIDQIFSDQPYQARYVNLAVIGDPSILVRTLKLYAEMQDVEELEEYFIEANPFNYATRSSRGRHFRSIRPLLLNTLNKNHRELLFGLISKEFNQRFLKHITYLQVCLNSRLFRELTINVFGEKMQQGALKITKNTLENYILEEVPKASDWTDTTVGRLGSRYLKLMSTFGFLEGEDSNQISIFTPYENLIIYVVYLYLFLNESDKIDITDGFFQLIFEFDQERLFNQIKSFSVDGYFEMEAAGNNVRLETQLGVDELASKLRR